MGRLVGVALLALLLAQWTARMHAIAHAPFSAGQAVSEAADGPWGHDAGTPSCELIDHLLIGQATAADPPAKPQALPADTLGAPSHRTVVRGVSLLAYEARGPPWA